MYSNLAKKVYDTIVSDNLIVPKDTVILGLSGGPDSVCLFNILLELKETLEIDIICAHLNHMLRGEEADDDERFVIKLCKEKNVRLELRKVNVALIANESCNAVEEIGRKERYLFFDEISKKIKESSGCQSPKILLAHNEDDNAETVLFRIIRGAGTAGVSGIPIKRKSRWGFDIARPLLRIPREKIEEYIAENNIDAVVDSSNKSLDYARNNIRLEVIPYLEKASGVDVKKSLVRLSENASLDKEYFEETVTECINEHWGQRTLDDGRVILPRKIFTDIHPAIRFRMIVKIFSLLDLNDDISSVHLASANKLIEKGETGQTTDFPKGYAFGISYDNCVFLKPKTASTKPQSKIVISLDSVSKSACNYKAKIKGNTHQFDVKILSKAKYDTLSKKKKTDLSSIHLDYESLIKESKELMIRCRENGDRIRPKGMVGRKKIQDLFVDEKIPAYKRDEIPLLIANAEVLWVPGIKKSSSFSVTECTENIIEISIIEQ